MLASMPREPDPQDSLPSTHAPDLAPLFRAAETVWSRRRDVRAEYGSVRSRDFWVWLFWHGALEHEEVAALLPEAPPEGLLDRVIGDGRRGRFDPRRLFGRSRFRRGQCRRYLESGLVDWRRVCRCLESAGFDVESGGRLLELGCGTGRLLQFFSRYAVGLEVHGADVDSEALEWCGRAAPFSTLHEVRPQPALPFADGELDGVYSFSVFSHLSEGVHLACLAELRRVCRSGATLVLTVQGGSLARRVASGELAGLAPSPSRMEADRDQLEEEGLLFYPYSEIAGGERAVSRGRTLEPDEYGSTFVLDSYVRRVWARDFEVVEVLEAPDDYQDYVVLRRP